MNGSTSSSPRTEQIQVALVSPAHRRDHASSGRSPNAVRPSRSPEPSKSARGQQPGFSAKTSHTSRPVRSPEPTRTARSPEPLRSAKSLDPVRAAGHRAPDLSTKRSQTLRPLRSPEPARSAQTPSPAPNDNSQSKNEETEPRTKNSDAVVRFKTPAQVMAGMAEVSKPPVPERSASRRRSITEQARSLLRMKTSFPENEENALSNTNLPIQSPSGEPTPTNRPSSPSVARSLSSRKAQAMSMSTYSASPTSPMKTSDFPPDRKESPAYTRAGKHVPSQSSYEILAFPAHSRTTSLDRALSIDSARPPEHSRTSSLDDPASLRPSQEIEPPVRTELPPMARYAKPVAALDDSEGNVNAAHPLLQKARHTRFATKNGSDLPLRHYKSHDVFTHSNPDLSQRQADDMVPPKRSSSLLYQPNARSLTPTISGAQTAISSPYPNRVSSSYETKRSPTPNQTHQNDSAVSLVNRAHAAPAESELGIHPAHRTPEPPSASTAASSPSISTISSRAELGATPPPINTVRSPKSSDATIKSPKVPQPSRFAPSAPSQLQSITAPTSNSHSREASKDYPPESNPKYKTTATNNTPFYLNPASSQALLDFLASTPPPSPPHPGTRTEPNTPATASEGTFFNRPFIVPEDRRGESSPPPFAVGRGGESTDAIPRAKTGDGTTREKKGWKKLFGGGGAKTEKPVNGVNGRKEMKQKKKKDVRKNVELRQVYGVGTGAQSVDGRIGEGGKDGYVGLGKDGEWITRKNFVKT